MIATKDASQNAQLQRAGGLSDVKSLSRGVGIPREIGSKLFAVEKVHVPSIASHTPSTLCVLTQHPLNLERRVPIPRGATGAKIFLDHGICQF